VVAGLKVGQHGRRHRVRKKTRRVETDWFGGYFFIYFMGKRVWLFFFFFFISCMSDASSDCTSCACLDIRVAPLRLAQQPFSF
jgi:hypothetical protein